jgi:hypothetical protein
VPSLRELLRRAEAGDPEAIAELERFRESTSGVAKALASHVKLNPMTRAMIDKIIDTHPHNPDNPASFGYGVVLPYAPLDTPPSMGAAPYNLIKASVNPSKTQGLGLPYQSQITLDEMGEPYTAEGRPSVVVRARLSADALRVLTVVCGEWRVVHWDVRCKPSRDGLSHVPECKHRGVGFSYTSSALARVVFGSDNGENVARVKASLRELSLTEFEWGLSRDNGATFDAIGLPEPALLPKMRIGRGTGKNRERKAITTNSHEIIRLGERLHQQLLDNHYTLIRPALLTGWRESWQVELVLRLYAHTVIPRSSRTMRRDGRAVLGIGRETVLGLGSAKGDLFPTYYDAKRWADIRKALRSFCDRFNRESQAGELHIELLPAKRSPNGEASYLIEATYPTAKPARVRASRKAPAKLGSGKTYESRGERRANDAAEDREERDRKQRERDRDLDAYANLTSLVAEKAPEAISDVVRRWITLPKYSQESYAMGYGVALRDALDVAGISHANVKRWGTGKR